MVQELHILRCFSCETFQSHIVKKTNKWECKICGIKQSVKKIYGRGSGKDCRIHTQKLNALRGQKEETESPDQQIKEVSEAEPPVRNVLTNDHPTSASTNNVFKRTSKWTEFVDENETGVDQNDFSKPEKNYFTPIITCKRKAEKRKIRDEFNEEVEGYSDDFNSVDDSYSVSINTHSSVYTKETSFNECNTRKNNSYKNNNVDSDYNSQGIYRESVESVNNTHFFNNLKTQNNNKPSVKWAEYLENEEGKKPLKTPSQNTTNFRQKNSKVSFKWAKYLEEEDLSSAGTSSVMTSTNQQLESEVGVSIKKIKYHEVGLQEGRDSNYSGVVTLDHLRSVSSNDCEPLSSNDFEITYSNSEMGQVISNPFEKISSNHFVSSSKTVKSSKTNFNWSLNSLNRSDSTWRKKSYINTDTNSFVFDSNSLKQNNTLRDDTLNNEFNRKVDNSIEKVSTQDENLNSKTISLLPVFEQCDELSDSDFQLDF